MLHDAAQLLTNQKFLVVGGWMEGLWVFNVQLYLKLNKNSNILSSQGIDRLY